MPINYKHSRAIAVCPIWLPIFSFFFHYIINEPGLGAEIDPGMALTPFSSSIGCDSNPRPFNCESSLLTTRPDFSPTLKSITARKCSDWHVICCWNWNCLKSKENSKGFKRLHYLSSIDVERLATATRHNRQSARWQCGLCDSTIEGILSYDVRSCDVGCQQSDLWELPKARYEHRTGTRVRGSWLKTRAADRKLKSFDRKIEMV